MKTTRYFDVVRPKKHPEVSRATAEWVVFHFEHEEVQADGRLRRWSYVEELSHWVRVVLLEDGETLHNAFIDGHFRPV